MQSPIIEYLYQSVLLSFLPKGVKGYAEEVGGFGEIAIGMGYGGCDFVFLIACFEFELNVCAGVWCVEIQFFRGNDLSA